MLRLLRWSAALAALAAMAAFVPVGGRTVLDRWRSARTPAEFASRALGEIGRALGRPWREPPAPGRARPRALRDPPVEHHTEADRDELDAIVAERAR